MNHEYQFQLPVSLLNVLINLYCMCAICFVKELHKSNYILVAVQCIIDFSIGGVMGLVLYIYRIPDLAEEICKRSIFSSGT